MKGIMEDVLQLARIQAGRQKFEPVVTNLDVLCREMVEEFNAQMPSVGRVQYTRAGNSRQVNLDVRLMRQVIGNLISNALKYSPEDQPVKVELAQTESHSIITVRDKGIGIPAEDRKHLFEPFHRATNVGTISGTGLGLSITKQSVELHGGTITVDSQIGQGTIMTVTIPVQSAAHSGSSLLAI